ncbi:MAG: FG-GAP-like repeat-containing protein [bacterium]
MRNNIFINMTFLFLSYYAVNLHSQEIEFEKHSIDLNFAGIQCVKIIDLDADGDLDIIGGSEITPSSASKGIAWWRNNGGFPITWSRFTIDASFIHVMSVDAAYIDSDTHPDIVATSWQLNQVAWWKNSGNPVSGWTKTILKTNYTNAHDAQCADIDLDGDTDIVTCNSNPGSVDILYNQNSAQPSWSNVQIGYPFASAKSINIIELDFDNDFDIVAAADGANDIAWWENTGNNSQVWNKKIIENYFDGAAFTSIIDMNNDSKLDIIGSGWSSNQIVYWLCNDLSANDWTQYIVTTTLVFASKGTGCDIDLDGDVDIVALSKDPGDGKLVLFINDNFTWTTQILLPDFLGGAALELIDLDNDGDKDIIAGAGILGDLYWLENKTIATNISDDTQISETSYELNQNYPNPFNNTTVFSWRLAVGSEVTLKMYNVLGKEVAVLVDENQSAGLHNIVFDASQLSSGVYYYTLRADKYFCTKKLILIK